MSVCTTLTKGCGRIDCPIHGKYVEATTPQGHDAACYYCNKPCNAFAGNPGLWPIPLCHADDPGHVKWHHTECIAQRLEDAERFIWWFESRKSGEFMNIFMRGMREGWTTGLWRSVIDDERKSWRR